MTHFNDLNKLKELILSATIGKRVYQRQFDRDRQDIVVSINACNKVIKALEGDDSPEEKYKQLVSGLIYGIGTVVILVENFIETYRHGYVSDFRDLVILNESVDHVQVKLGAALSKAYFEKGSEPSDELKAWFPSNVRRKVSNGSNKRFASLPGMEPVITANEDVKTNPMEDKEVKRSFEMIEKDLLDLPTNSFDHLEDTPSSRWHVENSTDPHPHLVEQKRRDLALGDLTDDELANACFMCDHRMSLHSMGFLMAVKERIRWLSRQLELEKKKNATNLVKNTWTSGSDQDFAVLTEEQEEALLRSFAGTVVI